MNLPQMQAVSSSNVESIGYNEETKELYVSFLNKSTYKYSSVPEEVYKEMLTADSVGCYLNKKVKKLYAYEKVV